MEDPLDVSILSMPNVSEFAGIFEYSFPKLQQILTTEPGIENAITLKTKETAKNFWNLCKERFVTQGKRTTVVIDGNIGAGKSTLLRLLQPLFDPETTEFLFEKIEEWTKLDHYDLLQGYYERPKEEAISFQLFVFAKRLEALKNIPQNKFLIFTERDPISDYLFASFHKQLGNITKGQFHGYDASTRLLLLLAGYRPPDLYLFMDVEPEECFSRKNGRARSQESSIAIEYLSQLGKVYRTIYPHKHGETMSTFGFKINYQCISALNGSHNDERLLIYAIDCISKSISRTLEH